MIFIFQQDIQEPQHQTGNGSLKSMLQDSVARKQPGPAPKPVPRVRDNQNLQIGGSKYIQPKTDFKLSTEKDSSATLVLPQHKRKDAAADWLTILLLLIFVLFVTVRNTYGKYLESLLQSLFNYATSIRMFEEKNYSLLHAAIRLDLFFYLTFSVFVFQLVRYFDVELPYTNAGLFLFCLAVVAGYFTFKKAIYKLLGFVVDSTEETGEYLFNADNMNRIIGLALFPVVLLMVFFPIDDITIPVITGIIIVVLIYLLLLHRGFIILMKKQFSIFYLFLYFCTLEFLPLVLLYKVVVL